MKKLIPFFLLAAGIVACEGPDSPQGEKGEPGLAGTEVQNFVFEYDNVDLKSPDYASLLAYPDSFTGEEKDVTLVYMLWDVTDNNTNVWRALPQSLMTENGTIKYNYDFTESNANLIMTTDFDKEKLESMDTDDWVVRVVVVPGKYMEPNGKLETVDLSDYNAVVKAMGAADKPVSDSYNDITRRN